MGSGADHSITKSASLVPTSPAGAPCPMLPVHRQSRGRCRGHSARCTNTALVHSISTGIFINTTPHSALVSENAAEVSNQATVATVTARQSTRQGHQLAPEQPVALDEVLRLDNDDRPVPRPPGPHSCPAGPWTTSSPPKAPCHPSGPQRQRRTRAAVDSVTAVAFPATSTTTLRRRHANRKACPVSPLVCDLCPIAPGARSPSPSGIQQARHPL